MANKLRAQRVAERIRQELAGILLLESSDPRLSGITITDVELDRELEYATVYVSALEGSERAAEILEGLHHAQGFLRSELAQRIELRAVPRLRFRWDTTLERAESMERLFDALKAEREQSERNPAQTNDDESGSKAGSA